MKLGFILSALLISLSASAEETVSYNLLPTDTRLVPIAGEVVSIEPLCPDGMTCIANGTVIHLRFRLNSCMSRMTPVSYGALEADGRLNVYVSALEILNRRARVALCSGPTIVRQEITLINRYGDVSVQFLGHNL